MMLLAPYLELTSCCDNTIVLYFRPLEFGGGDGSYFYGGSAVNGLFENSCYSITNKLGDIGYVNSLPTILGNTLDSIEDCTFPRCECPACYILYSCDSLYPPIISNSNLEPFIGQFVTVFNQDTGIQYPGCYYITKSDSINCPDAVPVGLNPEVPCTCTLRCFLITGNPTSVTYVNSNYELVTTVGNTKVCSYIPPVVTGGSGNVYFIGLCNNNTCPDLCFKLTNCQSSETITVSNSEVLLNYYFENKIVTLMGYDGCWIIDTTENCDCAVDVSVLQVFDNCVTCLPIIAYKFINCKNSLQIKYSAEDFSAYVGKVVQLDCGDCWIVEQIDYTPPNIQTVTIDFTFDSCLACERIYYKLTDCQGLENPVYTYTDLTDQVGKVIKIENCDTCWEVEETRLIQTVSVVKLATEYIECIDCLLDQPCLCSKITNQALVAKSFTYLDCTATEQTVLLQAGETSDKVCLFNWILTPEQEAEVYIEYFGNCVNNQCPVEAFPKRKVKPGYSVPVCDTEKFEKITCKASEIYYKQVMRLRYGISNCCPEDEEKWLVKKELIDLQGLMDPNYTCTPVASCCQANDSCGCGCNTTLKTCNS